MSENKVTFGLKNVHYAPFEIVDGEPVFETPKPIKGAVELSNEPRGDMVEFYADDMIFYSASNNQGYEGTLSIAKIPDDFRQDVLGEDLDETDKVVNEIADARGKSFAIMFEFDGDVKATRHVMYNCTANRPNVTSTTKTESTEPNVEELTYIATPIEMNGKRMVKTKTTANTDAAIYDAWYDAVYQKVEEV